MTPAGKRTERPFFQQRAVDDNGDRLGDWEPGFQRWSRVVSRTRGETALQQRVQGQQLIELTVLSDSATREIDTSWRVFWKGQAFGILSVTPTEDRAEINVLAQAGQTDA